MSDSGAQIVVKALEDEGALFTFGIPGTHNIELYDALATSEKVTAVLVTDEQAASFMADGVSRSSETIGVVNVVPGAGLTHALSGVAEAFMDGIPLVVLSCGIRTDTGRAFQLHDIDQLAVVRPVVKEVLPVRDPSQLYATVRRAFSMARAGTPGPVVVEVPAEFYLLHHDFGEPVYEPAARAATTPDPGAIEAAARVLSEASRPLMYVGYGARAAPRQVRALAERLHTPVATTIQGKGVFPESHPLFLWNGLGRTAPPFVREVERSCDVMLAVGCRFGEVGTGSWGFTPPGKLVHVDINRAVFNRNFPASVTVEAEAANALAALVEKVPPRPRDRALERAIAEGHASVRNEWRRHASSKGVTPAVLFETLQGLAGADAIFTADSGNGTFLAMEHLRLDAPGRFLAPVDYSCMGYSVPAAIGAKLANPGRDVVALAGDGALLMTGLELLTAAAYRAGVVVVVLRDEELAQIAQFQRTVLNRATNSRLAPYSVETFAAATNCAYLAARTDAEVRDTLNNALRTARSGTPVMVEATIDYSRKTWFTQGVVAANFWRLPWSERLRLLARAVSRRLGGS
ncbi:MAG TPA: thiamine pyrophosphate-binding protein [Thermoanaerobaculaceae bacterium]|nr:thiamine pyrophosphate-binding protein [Thermoanaerobaculaceae bacterium]